MGISTVKNLRLISLLTCLSSESEGGLSPELTGALAAARPWEALLAFRQSPISVADVSPSLIRATCFEAEGEIES